MTTLCIAFYQSNLSTKELHYLDAYQELSYAWICDVKKCSVYCSALSNMPVEEETADLPSPGLTTVRNLVAAYALFSHAFQLSRSHSDLALQEISLATLQMKGRWESNINVWSPFMYSQKGNFYFQNRIIMFCLPVPTLIYLWEIYIFPGSVCLFCCRELCGPILGIYVYV